MSSIGDMHNLCLQELLSQKCNNLHQDTEAMVRICLQALE